MNIMNRKIFKFILISFLILIITTLALFVLTKNKDTLTENKNFTPAVVIKNKKTTLSFVGDIMLTRGVESSVNKNFNGDYNKLFENLNELKNSDILFGNLEGDISDIGKNVGSKYSFRMDPKVLPALKEAGFDIFSFANNHVGDWSIDAFKDTLLRLKDVDILKTGAGQDKKEASEPTIIKKNGINFGFLGFSDVGPAWIEAKKDKPGILLASDPDLEEIIKNAKKKCDVLIVSFHFGEEYKLIHNERQKNLAHTAIDNGADIIIGHHPHVVEDIEEYKGKPIVYSLGNFIFDQNFSKDTMRGMLFEVIYDGKNLVKTNKRIITLNKKYQPEGIFDEEEIKKKDEVNYSNCPKPKKEYKDMSLLNIGQIIGLPDITYIPKNLVELSTTISTRRNICLIQEAKDAFESMSKNALIDGNTIKVSSGFRSYEYQKGLISNSIKSGKTDTDISIAKAGYSEHQLGTAIDITGASIEYGSATGGFDKTPEELWLRDNAYLYGFIRSYPEGKENITGYKYEPWHYRYVGIDNSTKIKDSRLTITEFLK